MCVCVKGTKKVGMLALGSKERLNNNKENEKILPPPHLICQGKFTHQLKTEKTKEGFIKEFLSLEKYIFFGV